MIKPRAFLFGTLGILLGIELFVSYDTWDRRLALAVTNLLSAALYLFLERFFRRKYRCVLPVVVLAAMVAGIWLDAVGNFLFFYAKYSWWDDFVHFAGTISVAIAAVVIVGIFRDAGIIRFGKFALGLFSISMTMLLASFYEITELWGDLLFGMHRIGERLDTAFDLQWDLVGAIMVTVIGTRRQKNPPLYDGREGGGS